MGLLHRAYAALRNSCLTAAVFRQRKNDATRSGSTASSRLQEVTHELEDLHVETESIDIEAQLQHHKTLLQEQRKKESFLGMRAYKYRKALDDRAMLLREEERKLRKMELRRKYGNPEDEEAGDCDGHLERKEIEDRDIEEMTDEEIKAARADLELRTKNWERDEDALQRIVATHRQILIHCEEIRRNIRTLERKRNEIASMRGEFEAFLMDSRVEELYETTPAVGVDDVTEGRDGAEAEAEKFLGAV